MKVEPQLQKVNEGDCLNTKSITPFDKTFLDVRVSHPNCFSNRTTTLQVQGGGGAKNQYPYVGLIAQSLSAQLK